MLQEEQLAAALEGGAASAASAGAERRGGGQPAPGKGGGAAAGDLRTLAEEVPPSEISPTFPYFDHHDKNRRRNEHKCRVISVTASVLITK
jgi:hypothetical protein